MRRIFICGAFNFPRGGSSSNYIQYFGMGLRECGYEVHLLTTRNRTFTDRMYKGLIIDEVTYRIGKVPHYYDFKVGLKNQITRCLSAYNINSTDVVMVYSHNLWLHNAVQKLCRKNSVTVGAFVVEYYSFRDFRNEYLSIDYWQNRYLNRRILPRADLLFPISTYIYEKFSAFPVKQMILPAMADPDEYNYSEKCISGPLKFVFPGAGKIKDSIENMLLAVAEILKDLEIDVEFHFCGITEKHIRRILNLPHNQIFDHRIITHGWMHYEDLVALYQQMHFLLLARGFTEMTQANFPSKVPELMCHGVIPIATRVGDYTRFYLQDGENSIIINGDQVDQIKKAVLRAVAIDRNRIIEMSDNARQTAETKFGYRNWNQKICNFIEKSIKYDNHY